MEPIQINNVQPGKDFCSCVNLNHFCVLFFSDTGLNLAAHRQKCDIVDLLLEYHANPNLANQAGKTALHRAIISYNNENSKYIRSLLCVSKNFYSINEKRKHFFVLFVKGGADPTLEDRNNRTPMDEAVFGNRSG